MQLNALEEIKSSDREKHQGNVKGRKKVKEESQVEVGETRGRGTLSWELTTSLQGR